MEDDIGLGDFLQCRRVQTVQNAMKHGASSHDADCLPVCWDIALEVAIHGHGCKQQLCAPIFSRGSPRDLTQQIQPARQPRYFWDPFFRREVLAGEV